MSTPPRQATGRDTGPRAGGPSHVPRPQPFTLSRARDRERPLVVEVPHAGLAVPDDVRTEIHVSSAALLRDADLFVDRFYASTLTHGGSLLVSHVSRYVVDLNRAEDDVDRDIVPDHPRPRPQQVRGVIWKTTTTGELVMPSPLTHASFEQRLARYHRPYHAALEAEIERKKRLFGWVLLVCAHSMPSVTRPGAPRRADVVPGSRGGTTTSPRVLDTLDASFRARGLTVRHDDPYKGGYTTQKFGRPRDGIHAVQIELSRALYVDERTSEPDDAGFARLTQVIDTLLGQLVALDLG
ncbi:MAG: N-formylglutamate amidohydrolase [Sandaracinus sp.]